MFFIYSKESRLDFIQNVILRTWSLPMGLNHIYIVHNLCLISVVEVMYEVDPKSSGRFELKPTSIQNLLCFVCIIEVFGKIILYVSESLILKYNIFLKVYVTFTF